MDVDQLLYHYVTDGIAANHKKHVGIEIEMPLVSRRGGEIALDFVEPMFAALEKLDMHVSRRADNGTPLAVKDRDGHVLTFDTCYENLEFASGSAPSFWPIYRRFREVLQAVQETLAKFDLCVLGAGYNPLIQQPHMIESELTLAIAEYFQDHPVRKRFAKDFYCNISSEQVHFNTNVEELPKIFELFTRLDWLNILLFADSPATIGGEHFLCARNELYTKSSFAQIGLVGAQRLGLNTAMDIAKSYRDVGMFMRRRKGRLEVFQPMKVCDYLASDDALPEDVACLDLERNIVTTSYGTVEYRILCSQPFGEAFVPSAFNLGIRMKLDEALALARDFDASHDMPQPNERNRLASLGRHPFASEDDVRRYAQELLKLSQIGLQERGFGEESLLRPLQNRGDLLTDCPALRLMRAEKELGKKQAFEARSELGTPIEPAQ